MKQVSGKKFIRLIQKRGWLLKRISGSHHVFIKEGRQERSASSFRFTVINH